MLHMVLLLATTFAWAEEVDYAAVFQKANEAYDAKDYQSAVDGYEQILTVGQSSPDLYYNLGNAYFRLGNMGQAILNYERVLKLEPDFEDAAFNLKLANLRIVDKVEPATEIFLVEWYHSFLHSRSASGWGIWALVFVWLALVAGAAYIFGVNLWLRRLGFGVMGLMLLGSVLFIYLAYSQHQYVTSNQEAIIVATNTYVKAAPDESSTDLFILREGTKLTILESQDGWLKVKLPDNAGDKVGWVKDEVLGLI